DPESAPRRVDRYLCIDSANPGVDFHVDPNLDEKSERNARPVRPFCGLANNWLRTFRADSPLHHTFPASLWIRRTDPLVREPMTASGMPFPPAQSVCGFRDLQFVRRSAG